MVAVAFRQDHEAGSVKIDAAEVFEIRILSRAHAHGGEPDLPGGFIHAFDPPHHPRSLGDLHQHFARGGFDSVKMIEAIAFGHPEELRVVGEELLPDFVRVVHESARSLLGERAHLTRGDIHREQAQDLMPALVVKHPKGFSIGAGFQMIETPRSGKERIADRDGLFVFQIEQRQPPMLDGVARLGIRLGGMLWLKLVRR